MKNYKESGFKFDDLFLDFESEDFHIKVLIKISNNVKYVNLRTKRVEKFLDRSFLKHLKFIEDQSNDITQDYTCASIIGLSLANEYGENARQGFHIICKNNAKYNAETCDKNYTKYLLSEPTGLGMLPVYFLYAETFHILSNILRYKHLLF